MPSSYMEPLCTCVCNNNNNSTHTHNKVCLTYFLSFYNHVCLLILNYVFMSITALQKLNEKLKTFFKC